MKTPGKKNKEAKLCVTADFQAMVREFMIAQGFERQMLAKHIIRGDANLLAQVGLQRLHLFQEEAGELAEAMSKVSSWPTVKHVAELADALGDLLYVVYGTAEAYGVDLEPVFEEIHRSNMTKEVRRSSLELHPKGGGFQPPQLEKVIERTMPWVPHEVIR